MVRNIIKRIGFGPIALKLAIWNGKLVPQPLVLVPRSACLTSVVRWDEWLDISNFGKTGCIEYFRFQSSESMEKVQLAIAEVSSLVQEETLVNHRCNLTDVIGMSSSSNNVSSAKDMEAFAQMFCPDYIKPVTESRMREMITYPSVKLDDMTFSVFSWTGRGFYWNNDDGSHHLSAARHIALQLGINWPLKGRLSRYILSKRGVTLLRHRWHLVLLPFSAAYSTFMDAMERDRCPFGLSEMPDNLHYHQGGNKGLNVVWLDRHDPKAERAATVLLKAGFPDLGRVLEGTMNDCIEENHFD